MRTIQGLLIFTIASCGISQSGSAEIIYFKSETISGEIGAKRNEWVCSESNDLFFDGVSSVPDTSGSSNCPSKSEATFWVQCSDKDIEITNRSHRRRRCIPKSDVLKIEKGFFNRDVLASMAKHDQWGPPDKKGLVRQLIPLKAKYKLGEPIELGLIVKNVGDIRVTYNKHAVGETVDGYALYSPPGRGLTSVFKILDDEGGEVLNKSLRAEYDQRERIIEPGQIITLINTRDLTTEYAFTKPGNYTVELGFAKSNRIAIIVEPGTVQSSDTFITRLATVLPDKLWSLQTFRTWSWVLDVFPREASPSHLNFWMSGEVVVEQVPRHSGSPSWSGQGPSGREDIESLSAWMSRPHRTTGRERWDDPSQIIVWQTRKRVEPLPPQREYGRPAPLSEYLGEGNGYHYYALARVVQNEIDWPKFRKRIVQALEIAP